MPANNCSMDARSDPFESARSHFFDTGSWGPFCDVTLTMKQGRQSDSGAWTRISDYPCRQAFRHFMNLLNGEVYGGAFRRYGKRLRVLPVLEKGEVRARDRKLPRRENPTWLFQFGNYKNNRSDRGQSSRYDSILRCRGGRISSAQR